MSLKRPKLRPDWIEARVYMKRVDFRRFRKIAALKGVSFSQYVRSRLLDG